MTRQSSRFTPLRTAITLWFLGLFFVAFALKVFVSMPMQQSAIRQALIEANQGTLEQLGKVVITPMIQRDYSQMFELLDSQETRDGWRLRVLRDDGKQLYPLDPWEATSDQNEILIIQQLSLLDDSVGELQLALNLEPQLSRLEAIGLNVELLDMAILSFGLIFLFFYFKGNITFPLEKISDAMAALTRGDFQYPLPKVKHAELDRLIADFGWARERIHVHQEKLIALRQEADMANRAKSNFLSHMSHELRTPLYAIIGITDFLLYEKAASPDVIKKIETLSCSGQHLLSLLNDMLDLPKLESGVIDVFLEPLAVDRVFENISEVVEKIADEKGKKITFEVRDNPAIVIGDNTRLTQVLFNLISNACKYGGEHSDIGVFYQRLPGDRGEILVCNAGKALSEEEKIRIFSPFERLDIHKSIVDGAGIGLAIAKRLVDLMGGALTVRSDSGYDVVFAIELPVTDEEPQFSQLPAAGLQPEVQADDVSSVSDAKFALVVDDDSTNQMVLGAQLEHLGYKFVVADSAIKAIDLLNQLTNIDVVLTDVRMPGMTGIELTRHIRGQLLKSSSHIKIVGISAYAMDEDIKKAMAAGMDGYLTKPFRLADLGNTLSRVLSTSDQH